LDDPAEVTRLGRTQVDGGWVVHARIIAKCGCTRQCGLRTEALRCHQRIKERSVGIVVYWLEGEAEGALPVCEFFGSSELMQALALAEDRRRQGHRHVSISTELDDVVGRPGVAAVEGGRTPDGQTYEWSKAGRAGKVRRGKG
jgi:hypothetical protein